MGENIKRLPELLSKPEAIIRMDKGRLNIISSVTEADGRKVLTSVELGTVKDINQHNEHYNLVVSTFSPKDNYLRNTILNRGVAVEYTREDLPQVNNQLYEWLTTINDKSSIDSIAQEVPIVNTETEKNVRKSKKPKQTDGRAFEEAVRRSGLDFDDQVMSDTRAEAEAREAPPAGHHSIKCQFSAAPCCGLAVLRRMNRSMRKVKK